MKKKPALVLSSLALCGLGLFSLGCPPKGIRVGAVLPLTGEAAVYGEPVGRGVELAYEEIQASGDGIQLELSIVDSESDPEKAAELLRDQYDGGSLLAVGGVTTAEAKRMIPVAEDKDRVLLSPSASEPELTGLSRNFFRIFPSDFRAAGRMAQFVSQDLKVNEIVVIAEQAHEYAKGIQVAFQSAYESYGGAVVEVLEFPPNTSDFSGLIDRVMTLDPKAVYLTAYGEAIGQMVQELRGRNYKGKILTTSAFSSPRFIAPVGDAAAGVMLTQSVFELDSDYAHVKKFVERYRSKYGEDPDIYAAHGYDALRLIAAALKDRPALGSEVIKGLRDIKDFPGVTGSLQFDEKGDVLKYPRVYIIGKDLSLYDYTERVRQQQAEMRKKREELRKKLEDIERRAREMGN